MKSENNHCHRPDWSNRADHTPWRPDWQDFIPHQLWELGEVFFPLPRGEKGWRYPHHMQEYRYTADSELLNAYFESGWGYGIACAGDLAVVDVDNLAFDKELMQDLPETLWQLSGSKSGKHYFYFVEGLNKRQNLYAHFLDERVSRQDVSDGQDRPWVHIGEVKCDPHGYVVGPGSMHPSGNIYGPLQGDEIATISKDDLMEAIEPFEKPESITSSPPSRRREWKDIDDVELHEFYSLSADDVLPWLGEDERIAHPVHGSDTNSNFMKNEGGETFTCWRCQYGSGPGCGLNGAQFLAVEATRRDCEDVRLGWSRDYSLHWEAWRRAVEQGLIGYSNIPYSIVKGYGVAHGVLDNDEKPVGSLYWDLFNAIKYEMDLLVHIV